MKGIIWVAGMLLAGSVVAQTTHYRCEVDGVIVLSDQPCNPEQIERHAEQRAQQPPTRPSQAQRPVRILPSRQMIQLDIAGYCERIRQQSGSYQIRAACLESERSAKSRVFRMQVPPEITAYCNRIGEHSGSYQIMEACIKQEIAAQRREH